MRIGIDDTDSPEGMCTTYLGAALARALLREGFIVHKVLLVRLNPNVPHKTRGNASVCLEVEGDRDRAYCIGCDHINQLADLSHKETQPGLVICEGLPDPSFYKQAVRDFCTIEEAEGILGKEGALYRGWNGGRGLIGATAAVCAEFPDTTYELLAYRHHESREARLVERESVFAAEDATFPHTWDSVDREENVVVCVPHTPDPVLFGIRGESPAWVKAARGFIQSETPVFEQLFCTNQGTDAHIICAMGCPLLDGRSYAVCGTVTEHPVTSAGGHVRCQIHTEGGDALPVMAFEPTKGFRRIVRLLAPGDRVVVVGSYKDGCINLEKIGILSLASTKIVRPPLCPFCGRRMTSAGREKGYKCRRCKARAAGPEVRILSREITPGWYEVPSTARRHLALPLVRCNDGTPSWWQKELSVTEENL